MCRADNNVWFKPAKKANGTCYYNYVLVYTEDILCVAENPKEILDKLDQHFLLKPSLEASQRFTWELRWGLTSLSNNRGNLIGAWVHRLTSRSQQRTLKLIFKSNIEN